MRKTTTTGFAGISLFSGAGGLDKGLEESGVELKAFVECDRWAQETLRANFSVDGLRLFSDITQTDPEKLLEAANLAPGEAFVVAGGPPCQAFSTAGRRLSMQDPRGKLVDSYFQIVEAARPRFFVFENVRGLLSAAIEHRPLDRRGPEHDALSPDERAGSVLEKVVFPRFKSLGYQVLVGLVDAADYGVAQHRFRVIMLGSRDAEFGPGGFDPQTAPMDHLIPPTHAGSKSDSAQPSVGPGRKLPSWRTLKDALVGMPDEMPEHVNYSPARRAVFDQIPPGENWRYVRDRPELFPRRFLEKIMGGAFESDGGRVGFWRRLSWDQPCPTVTTSPVQKGTGLCHPDWTRPLSVQEYKRVQAFPDNYTVCGPTGAKYRQLGNAVPVLLAQAIGQALLTV